MTATTEIVDTAPPRVGPQDGAPVPPPAAGAPSAPLFRPCKGCGRPITRPARWCSTSCHRDTEGPLDPEDSA